MCILSHFNILCLLLSYFLLFHFVYTSNCILEDQQCGGQGLSSSCCRPLKCIFVNDYYSQCRYIEGTNCIPRHQSCLNIDEHDPLYQCCPDLICVRYNDYDHRCTLPINNILCVEQNHQCGGISNILGVEWNQAMECCPGLSCKGEIFFFFFPFNCQKTYPCLLDGDICGNFEGPNCCSPLVCEKTNDAANMRCSAVKSCVSKNGQCGGMFNIIGFIWNGNEKCCPGLTCKGTSKYYKQCLP